MAASISRRQLLWSTAASAPWIVTSGSLSKRGYPAETLKVGLIGCGGRGTGAALQALNADEQTVLWALADLFPEKITSCHGRIAEALTAERAAQIDVPPERRFDGFEAYQNLIASGVDVVLLATPPFFRPMMLRAAVEAGKHVFCEKPMGVDAPGVRSVMESAKMARDQGTSLVSGFCWRYKLSHRATWGEILGGRLGEVQTVYTNYNTSPLRAVPRQEGWSDIEWQLRDWQHFLWASGDHLVEQACHSLDKQAWSFGDAAPLSCTAIGGRQAREGEETGNIYDHFGLVYDYPGGAKAFHMCRQIAGCSNDNSDFVWGTKGHAIVNGWSNHYEILGENPWVYEGPANDMYQQEHDELFASIRSGQPRNDGDWMATSTLLAIMGRLASYTGQTITWEQALGSKQKLGPKTLAFGEFQPQPVAVPGRTPFE